MLHDAENWGQANYVNLDQCGGKGFKKLKIFPDAGSPN